MHKSVKTQALFDCQTPYLREFFAEHEFPWTMLPEIKNCIRFLILEIRKGNIGNFTEISPDVFIGEGTTVAPTAVLEKPAVIGANCEIRPGAYIRGNVITGSGCVIGNSTELKNCILLESVQVPHYNYVGDSIVGNHGHLGAGSVCSNLKSTGSSVVVRGAEDSHGCRSIPTGLRKFGAMIGDGADVGCHCVLNPGTIIGRGSIVYPLTSVRGVIPENCIMKSTDTIVEKEAR